MTQPIRIQRKRTKGYDMQAESRAINGLDCVYVGRPTIFGNTFKCCGNECPTYDEDAINGYLGCCVWLYQEYFESEIEGRQCKIFSFSEFEDESGCTLRKKMVEDLPKLRGKNLACFCRLDQPCHADVLLELANR